MIFLCNSEGIIQAVSPSSINQGSVSLTELILLAPFPLQSVVQAMFKLPNGLIIRPQLLTQEEYDYNLSPLEQFNDDLKEFDLYAWSIKINKAITQFHGTLTVSFVITGTDAIITTTETDVYINKSGRALPIPVTDGELAEITQILQAAQLAQSNAEESAQEAKDAENYIKAVLPNIKKGEGTGSVVIGTDDTSEAYGENALSQGTGAIAGATAYRISSVSTFTDSIRIRIDISDGGISDREPSVCIVFLEIIEGDTSRNIVRFSTPEMNWYNSENGLANFFPSLLADVPFGTEINLSNSYIYISNNPYSGPVILGNNAFASGENTRAIFDNSTALGEGTRTSRKNQFVTGEYNADSPDALFIVGNGTEENPSNAFEVLADGTIIGDNLVDDIDVSLNNADYKLSISLKGQDGEIVGTEKIIDLPIEAMIVNVEYDNTNKDLILTLQNGNTIAVPLDDIIAGLPKNLIDGTADGAIQSTTSTLNGAGDGATARGAVAVGTATSATALDAFAEGGENKATAARSHAAGNKTHVRHVNSYTGGFATLSSAANQHTIGQFNAPDPEALFIVGNGTDDNNRSNALAVRKDGTIVGNLGGGAKLYRHTINLNKMAANSSWFNIDIITYSSSSQPITDPSIIPYNEAGVFALNLYDTPDGERLGLNISYYNNSYQGEGINLRYVGNLEYGVLSYSSINVDIGLITIRDTVTEV